MGLPPFQTFLEATRGRVYRFLLVAVGPHEADDCFQETYLSALRAYPKLPDGSNLVGWALTIATRKAIDAGRARRRRAVPVPDVGVVFEAAAADQTDGIPDARLWRAVAALPPKQRAAVAHRFVLDLPYRDIGAAMRITEEAARANVHEGLRRLRKEWRDDDEG